MAYYFVRGQITGETGEEDEEFYKVFQGTDNAIDELNRLLISIQTNAGRVPVKVDIKTFNKV